MMNNTDNNNHNGNSNNCCNNNCMQGPNSTPEHVKPVETIQAGESVLIQPQVCQACTARHTCHQHMLSHRKGAQLHMLLHGKGAHVVT